MVMRKMVVTEVDDIISRYGIVHPVMTAMDDARERQVWDVVVPEAPSRSVFEHVPYFSVGDVLMVDCPTYSDNDRTGTVMSIVASDNRDEYPKCRRCGSALETIGDGWKCVSFTCPGRTESRVLYLGDMLRCTSLANINVVKELVREGVIRSLPDVFDSVTWLQADWSDGAFIIPTVSRDMRHVRNNLYNVNTPTGGILLHTTLAGLSIPGLCDSDISRIIQYATTDYYRTGTHPWRIIVACFRDDDVFAMAVGSEYMRDPITRHVFGMVRQFAGEIERIASIILME